MNTQRSIIRLATIVIGTALLVSSAAVAQGHQRAARTAVRTARPSSAAISHATRTVGRSTASRLQRSPSIGRTHTSRSSGSRSAKSPYNLGDILGGLQSSSRNHGSDRYDPRDGYYGGYGDREHANADAYRDVGIANALVNLVGIIANSQVYNQPPPVAYRPAPPQGHYERQQVLIREGYYEDIRVWVPDYQNEQTLEFVAGHYEMHRRWVPPVYGFQDVWVP